MLKALIKKLLSLLPKDVRYSIYRHLVKIPNELPENLIFKIAETKEELEAAFVMLHDAYVGVGLLGMPDPNRIRVTAYHALPSSTTLIGKAGDEVIATLTIIRDSPMGLAADSYVDLSELRKGGDRIAEISALAIKKEYRGKVLLNLMKFMYESCVNYLGVNHIVALLSKKSKGHELYESILFFEPFREQKQHINVSLNSTPLRAMHLNLETAYSRFEEHYAGRSRLRDLFTFFTKTSLPCNIFPERHFNMINYATMSIDNFRYFFTERTSVLKSLSTKQAETLLNIFQGLPHEDLISEAHSLQNVVPLRKKNSRNRFDISLQTRAKTENEGFVPVRVLDISRQGLRISSKKNLGNSVEVEFKDSMGKFQYLTAQKIWQDDCGVYGFRIVNSDQKWHEIIDTFEAKTVGPIKKRNIRSA